MLTGNEEIGEVSGAGDRSGWRWSSRRDRGGWRWVGQSTPPKRTGRADPLSMFSIVALAALSLRMAGAVVGALLGWNQLGGATAGQKLGDSLETLGDFGDGQGVAMLVATMLVLLWIDRRADPTEAGPTGRWRWLQVLFAASVVGSVLIGVGNFLFYIGLLSGRFQSSHILATGLFCVSYVLIAIAGAVVCQTRAGRKDRGPASAEPADPYIEAS